MKNQSRGTAVGAGTEAGDAQEQEVEVRSRAAEAVEDRRLESVRTTGPAPTGVQADAEAAPTPIGVADRPETLDAGSHSTEAPPVRHSYSNKPRKDLQRNQAGIGSRLDSEG